MRMSNVLERLEWFLRRPVLPRAGRVDGADGAGGGGLYFALRIYLRLQGAGRTSVTCVSGQLEPGKLIGRCAPVVKHLFI